MLQNLFPTIFFFFFFLLQQDIPRSSESLSLVFKVVHMIKIVSTFSLWNMGEVKRDIYGKQEKAKWPPDQFFPLFLKFAVCSMLFFNVKEGGFTFMKTWVKCLLFYAFVKHYKSCASEWSLFIPFLRLNNCFVLTELSEKMKKTSAPWASHCSLFVKCVPSSCRNCKVR